MDESDFSDNQDEGDEKREEVLDPNNPDHAFSIIERNYMKVSLVLLKIESCRAAYVYDAYFRLLPK